MTNIVDTIQTALPSAQSSVQLHWPAFAALAAWATHANWDKILSAFRFIQAWCDTRNKGLLPLLFHCLFGWQEKQTNNSTNKTNETNI